MLYLEEVYDFGLDEWKLCMEDSTIKEVTTTQSRKRECARGYRDLRTFYSWWLPTLLAEPLSSRHRHKNGSSAPDVVTIITAVAQEH